MGLWADYTSRIAVADLKAAGVIGVSRYLAPASSAWKVITKGEYQALVDGGIQVLLNWEYGARDWDTPDGYSHGLQAGQQARVLGYPAGMAIAGSADFDMTRGQWEAHGRAYALAFTSGLAHYGYQPGVYGPWNVLQWVAEEVPGYVLFWQGMSTSWSGGLNKNLWPGTHIWQRHGSTIAGIDIDINTLPHGSVPYVAGGSVMAETLDTVAGLVRQVDIHMATREQEIKDYLDTKQVEIDARLDALQAAVDALGTPVVTGDFAVSGTLHVDESSA
jgi:hypothetical protein